MSRLLEIGLLSLALFVPGCGSGLAPIEGQVVWRDGSLAKELAGSQVVFEQAEKKTSSYGVIQADGSFRMTTIAPDDGVPAGKHAVAILEHRPNANAAGTQLVPAKLDLKYADLNSSGLECTVKPGKNEVTLTVERAPPP
jgi:hypothetical protein